MKAFWMIFSKKRRLALFFIIAVVFVSLGLIEARHALAQDPYYAPVLNVPIPGMDFTDYAIEIDRQAGTISIPFLAIYIYHIYKYLVSIVAIVATVMFIYGAFLYLLGSAITSIQSGKKIMIDSIIGMILILSTVAIVNVINPEGLGLKPLTIYDVRFESARPFTTVNTIPPGDYLLTALDTEGGCPMTLPIIERNAAFDSAVQPLLTGATVGEKILQAADIAVRCRMLLGFCGQAVGTVWTYAGVGTKECLTGKNPKGKRLQCVTHEKDVTGKTIHSSIQLRREGLGLLCDSRPSCGTKITMNVKCVSSRDAAQIWMRKAARQKIGGDYPDSWIKDIQPGDALIYFTGNNDCSGTHAAIFVGWENERGMARVFQGQVGSLVSYGKHCLSPQCGNWYPLTNIIRPK
jgi:hypothetical protein